MSLELLAASCFLQGQQDGFFSEHCPNGDLLSLLAVKKEESKAPPTFQLGTMKGPRGGSVVYSSKRLNGTLIYQCGHCIRSFTRKRNLVDHFRGHHTETKPHMCPFPGCKKSFLRPAHLQIHERIHTGEKPFICQMPGCGKRWNQRSALKQHLRSHTGEKPFKCTHCTKCFSTSSSCKRHLVTHRSGSQAISPPPKSPEYNSDDSTEKMSLTYLVN